MLYPDHFEQKIDFTAIRQLLKDKCVSTLGMEKVDEIQFSSDFKEVMRLISQTDEMLSVLQSDSDELPIGDFYDVRTALSRVRIEGLFLDEPEVFDLRRALEAVRRLVAFLSKHEAEVYPHLHELVVGVETFPLIIQVFGLPQLPARIFLHLIGQPITALLELRLQTVRLIGVISDSPRQEGADRRVAGQFIYVVAIARAV